MSPVDSPAGYRFLVCKAWVNEQRV